MMLRALVNLLTEPLHAGEGDLFRLILIFAAPGFVANFALLTLKEQELYDALVGIDAAVGTRGVREFQRQVPAPARLGGGEVGNDAAAGIGGLADANDADVVRHLNAF